MDKFSSKEEGSSLSRGWYRSVKLPSPSRWVFRISRVPWEIHFKYSFSHREIKRCGTTGSFALSMFFGLVLKIRPSSAAAQLRSLGLVSSHLIAMKLEYFRLLEFLMAIVASASQHDVV